MFADDAKFFRHIVQPHDISILQQAIDALQQSEPEEEPPVPPGRGGLAYVRGLMLRYV